MVLQFEEWLAPLAPWLEAAVPALPLPPPSSPDGKKEKKDKKEAAGPTKHKVRPGAQVLLSPCQRALQTSSGNVQ